MYADEQVGRSDGSRDDGVPVWLDCDPGHDDAIAILLAFYGKGLSNFTSALSKSLDVLGLSTTHGNASGRNTYINAVKLLSSFGISSERCSVWRGADKPLLRSGKADVGIHGSDGLGGVVGLPNWDKENTDGHDEKYASMLLKQHVQKRAAASDDIDNVPRADPHALIAYQLDLLTKRDQQGLPPITLIATGPLTNVALLWLMCPENGKLLTRTITEIVIMGGAAATSGNRTPLAEWNILVDPEAASIIFDSPIPVVMAGLNVTHQAIFTSTLHEKLLQKNRQNHSISQIRQTVSSAMTFFASSYANEFGFIHGPPIHDMLTVAYVLDKSLFYTLEPRQPFPYPSIAHGGNVAERKRVACKRFQVCIDTSRNALSAGTTVVDYYDQLTVHHDGWGKGGRNAIVLEYVDVSLDHDQRTNTRLSYLLTNVTNVLLSHSSKTDRLWPLLFDAVDRAEEALQERQ